MEGRNRCKSISSPSNDDLRRHYICLALHIILVITEGRRGRCEGCGGTLNLESFTSPLPWGGPVPSRAAMNHVPSGQPLQLQLRGRSGFGTRSLGPSLSQSGSGSAARSRKVSGQRRAASQLTERHPRLHAAPRRPPPPACSPSPGPAHPPVSAPESTQSSSSPPPALESMVRSIRGHHRDLGHARSGQPSPAQADPVKRAAGVSPSSRQLQHRPLHSAPRPLLATRGWALAAPPAPPRPSPSRSGV